MASQQLPSPEEFNVGAFIKLISEFVRGRWHYMLEAKTRMDEAKAKAEFAMQNNEEKQLTDDLATQFDALDQIYENWMHIEHAMRQDTYNAVADAITRVTPRNVNIMIESWTGALSNRPPPQTSHWLLSGRTPLIEYTGRGSPGPEAIELAQAILEQLVPL